MQSSSLHSLRAWRGRRVAGIAVIPIARTGNLVFRRGGWIGVPFVISTDIGIHGRLALCHRALWLEFKSLNQLLRLRVVRGESPFLGSGRLVWKSVKCKEWREGDYRGQIDMISYDKEKKNLQSDHVL